MYDANNYSKYFLQAESEVGRKMTKLEAMGYTAEQAEEVDRIARSIARTSGIPADEATQAICSVVRALTPLDDAKMPVIRVDPSLNIFQK